ncbi:MAG: 2-oxoacid:acceptor oxidoreductase family protein [Patescibacteria group bacterium]
MQHFNWKIGGAAGEGIKVAGLMLAKTIFKTGYQVHAYTEYPSLIRGGHNCLQIYADQTSALCQQTKLDILVALNDETLALHQAETTSQTIILSKDNLPFSQFPVMKNTVALGASCFLLNLDLKILNQIITANFAKKAQEIIAKNLQAAQAGYETAKLKLKPLTLDPLKSSTKNQILIGGNEALALGAVSGGVKLYCAYPMTPATSILHFLAANADKFNLVVHHAEDEIGVINLALGAAFTGVRAMVGTSGGGFSLMTEGLGLAAVSQTPLTIILSMRPGPASGMPTWSSQGDLLYAINASQDEFPRVVLTPGDITELFAAGRLAPNLAEKYQIPVIILTDKNLGEASMTAPAFPVITKNSRYLKTQTTKLANSYEHDDQGLSTEDSLERTKQVDKRLAKFTAILADKTLPLPVLYGPKTAATTLISWGSNKGPILSVLAQRQDVNYLHFTAVWPFPKNSFLAQINPKNKLITIECNATGQLNKLISQETGLMIKNQITKYDGRPFYPEEIIAKLKIEN